MAWTDLPAGTWRSTALSVNRRALVTPSVSIKSDTCGADRRRDPTPKHKKPPIPKKLTAHGHVAKVSMRQCNWQRVFTQPRPRADLGGSRREQERVTFRAARA